MEPEDLVTGALEPGERIVWSDRPHVGLWPPRRPRYPLFVAVAAIGWCVAAVLGLQIALLPPAPPTTPTGAGILLGRLALACLTGLPLVGLCLKIALRSRASVGVAYAVTERGRLVVVARGVARASALPAPEAISTTARADEEFGDLQLGAGGPVLRRVSYPLIALESIRSVAASRGPVGPAEVRPQG